MNLFIQNLESLFMRSFENILIDLEDADIDLILSNRDLYVFSNSWARAYKEIKKKPVNNQEQKQIDEIRKDIFMRVFSKTNSSDLSAYISDDFELICFHLLGNYRNKWVTTLCAAYFTSQIPQGKLVASDKTLQELISNQ
ncbi:hypothetical protein HDE68_004015 [Pedobacter cryoconitis]|uniref:Uncharacterized protein n=1 Tax=Pedobacter cryoconitis TaxID=188932 RepID=A0A7W8ZQ27_9SPHI|nr:hypothetical protein [Pedobacter cryoconitis]MBB5638089.1 hypothetical protein [Pedobacter cryoconitis]